MTPVIVRLAEMEPIANFDRQLDEIFYESSATKSFANEEGRSAFRERWLGRYLIHDRRWFYLALDGGRVVGYLAGCAEDPAGLERFRDIGYFNEIRSETTQYPAHLHVNVAQQCRSGGIGSRLITLFVQDLQAAGVRGVHLVTGKNSRNIPFYLRNGFKPIRIIEGIPSDSVMLARTVR